MYSCPSCHIPNYPGGSFCACCGSRFVVGEAPLKRGVDTKPNVPPNRMEASPSDQVMPVKTAEAAGEGPRLKNSYCTNCGKPVGPGNRFCGHCGTSVTAESP